MLMHEVNETLASAKPALFMMIRRENAWRTGEGRGHEARGKTFLLITPCLWPRASRLNIGDCSRSVRE